MRAIEFRLMELRRIHSRPPRTDRLTVPVTSEFWICVVKYEECMVLDKSMRDADNGNEPKAVLCVDILTNEQ